MEKKIVIILGFIAGIIVSMIITHGKIWPFLFMGAIAYFVWKNNR